MQVSIITLIRRFERAVRAHAWKGRGEPEEDARAEARYRKARRELYGAVGCLVDKKRRARQKGDRG